MKDEVQIISYLIKSPRTANSPRSNLDKCYNAKMANNLYLKKKGEKGSTLTFCEKSVKPVTKQRGG